MSFIVLTLFLFVQIIIQVYYLLTRIYYDWFTDNTVKYVSFSLL